MMHQTSRPQVIMPTARAAIHELTQRSMIRSVLLVVPRSVGNQPFSTSGEHPVKTNAPASAKPVIEVIFMRRLPVRFCELTDGPSSCCCSPAGRKPTGHTKVLLPDVELTATERFSPTCWPSASDRVQPVPELGQQPANARVSGTNR